MNYVKATNIEEALQELKTEESFVLAGGTDLLRLKKSKGIEIEKVVDIMEIDEIKGIETREEKTEIGATTRLKEVIENKEIQEKFPSIKDSAKKVATPQVRNMGTIGGNLLQRVQCGYYRNEEFDCKRKGGQACLAASGNHKYYHTIFNPSQCFATWTSDTAPALAALGAEVEIIGEDSERKVPVENLYLSDPPWREVDSKEIMTSIETPHNDFETVTIKHGLWQPPYFPIANIGMSGKLDGNSLGEMRIFFGAVSPTLYRAEEVENFLSNEEITEEKITKASEILKKNATPMKENEYKVGVVRDLLEKAVKSISG